MPGVGEQVGLGGGGLAEEDKAQPPVHSLFGGVA